MKPDHIPPTLPMNYRFGLTFSILDPRNFPIQAHHFDCFNPPKILLNPEDQRDFHSTSKFN
jgi:hypothetical protein